MIPWSVERLASCSSTMDEARLRLHQGSATHGTVVIADQMTSGRGQHGNAWHAPNGGLYLSLVLTELPERLELLTLAIGNAVADTLEVCGVEPQTKWVNDILVHGRKVAGVLAEAQSQGDRAEAVVVGIGINANGTCADWPDRLADTATTLEQELGCELCIEDLESTLLDCVAENLRQVAEDPQHVIQAFERRHSLTGQTATVDDVTGTVEGLGPDGAIRIRDGAGVLHEKRHGLAVLADAS